MPTNAELVRAGLEGFFAGDADALRDRLAPDAQWVWHRPSDFDCHSRDEILTRLTACHREGLLTRVVDVRDGAGDRVLVRWFGRRMERRVGVPDGVASIVVMVRDGRIARMQDCTGYRQALAAAGLANA